MGLNPEQFIDFDKWHGKAFRIAVTPSGRSSTKGGETINDEMGRLSIVTPENGDAWDWPSASPEQIDTMRRNWGNIQSDKGGKYKMDQIRRHMRDK